MPAPRRPALAWSGARLASVGLALVLLGQAALVMNVREFFTDDAWISLRYALRFAEGDGPVWNAGGPVVEGYSNPLLVFAEALGLRLGLDAWALARAQGVLAAVVTVVVVGTVGRRVLGRGGAVLAAAVVGLSPAMAYWSVGGLETAAYTLGVTTAVLLLATDAGPRPCLAAIAFAVLPWLRPEALGVILPVVVVSEAGDLWRGDQRPRALRRLAWLLGPALLSAVALEGLRLALYGHLLPNSVLYKSGNGKLFSVTWRFLGQTWPALPFAAVGLVALRGRARLVAVPALVALVGSPFFLNSVNDFSRLLLPTWPAWAVLTAAGIGTVATRLCGGRSNGRFPLVAGALGLLVVGALALATPASIQATGSLAHRYATCKAGTRREAADWLKANLGPNDVYAIADAGLVPYRADGTALDIFGLNEASLQKDPHVPAPRRAKQVLKAKPAWLVLTSKEFGSLAPHYKVERAIVARKEFKDYQLVQEVDGHVCGFNLRIYRRQAAPPPAVEPVP